MAIDYNGALLLADTVCKGIELKKVLTVGHLDFVISPATPKEILQKAGLHKADTTYHEKGDARFADDYLRTLGAASVTTMDASAYEGAEVVHDLNTPLPENLKGCCDTLIDGGSIEHIFNIPAVLKNYMELVAPGGYIIIHTPANNAFGHGFYQFSPELFFRTFTAENGFEVSHMVAHEMTRNAPMYRVLDPKVVGWRSDLINSLPSYLFVVARKISDAPIFSAWPQQADYSERWEAHSAGDKKSSTVPRTEATGLRNVVRQMPPWLQGPLQRMLIRWKWRQTLGTGRCFQPYSLFHKS